MSIEESFDLVSEGNVPAANFVEKLGALPGWPLESVLEDLIDSGPAFDIHSQLL
jgi:hypothetical protein